MYNWLASYLSAIRSDINFAALFGSSIQPNSSPRDVDMVIVTAGDAGGASWCRVSNFSKNIKPEFHQRFGLALSIIVVTSAEWSEIDGVVVRHRTQIL